jgi:hypothetical protein
MPPGLKTHKPTAQMIRTAAVSSQKGRAPPIRISVYNALGKSRLLLGLLLEPHGFDPQTTRPMRSGEVAPPLRRRPPKKSK